MSDFILPDDFNPGAFPDRKDERDLQYADLPLGAVQIDWDKGYNVEKVLKDKYGITLKVEAQGSSLSCVGQAFSKYAEVLNIVETKGLTDLSAKSIYEQIYLPSGGAYLRDGAKALVGGGVALESSISSYMGGNAPNEAYMRESSITAEIREAMKVYAAKEYRHIGAANVDLLAHAILNNWGGVGGARGDNAGWRKQPVQPPTAAIPWGHAYFYTAFGKDTKGKFFDFLNSWSELWGKGGRGRMYFEEYDMAKNTFGVWSLVDKPNLINDDDMKIVKIDGKSAIYLISADNKKRIMIVDMPTLDALGQSFKEISDEEMAKYEDGGTLVWADRIIA